MYYTFGNSKKTYTDYEAFTKFYCEKKKKTQHAINLEYHLIYCEPFQVTFDVFFGYCTGLISL